MSLCAIAFERRVVRNNVRTTTDPATVAPVCGLLTFDVRRCTGGAGNKTTAPLVLLPVTAWGCIEEVHCTLQPSAVCERSENSPAGARLTTVAGRREGLLHKSCPSRCPGPEINLSCQKEMKNPGSPSPLAGFECS